MLFHWTVCGDHNVPRTRTSRRFAASIQHPAVIASAAGEVDRGGAQRRVPLYRAAPPILFGSSLQLQRDHPCRYRRGEWTDGPRRDKHAGRRHDHGRLHAGEFDDRYGETAVQCQRVRRAMDGYTNAQRYLGGTLLRQQLRKLHHNLRIWWAILGLSGPVRCSGTVPNGRCLHLRRPGIPPHSRSIPRFRRA